MNHRTEISLLKTEVNKLTTKVSDLEGSIIIKDARIEELEAIEEDGTRIAEELPEEYEVEW